MCRVADDDHVLRAHLGIRRLRSRRLFKVSQQQKQQKHLCPNTATLVIVPFLTAYC